LAPIVKLREGVALDAVLVKRSNAPPHANASPRRVPAKIVSLADIPPARSGKIVEFTARDVAHRLPVKSVEALANPEALDLYKDLPELQS
jgi:acetoacetyl-CoA synthetase